MVDPGLESACKAPLFIISGLMDVMLDVQPFFKVIEQYTTP